jgi:hypothetical protein
MTVKSFFSLGVINRHVTCHTIGFWKNPWENCVTVTQKKKKMLDTRYEGHNWEIEVRVCMNETMRRGWWHCEGGGGKCTTINYSKKVKEHSSRSLSLRGFSVSPLGTRRCGSPIEMDGNTLCSRLSFCASNHRGCFALVHPSPGFHWVPSEQ